MLHKRHAGVEFKVRDCVLRSTSVRRILLVFGLRVTALVLIFEPVTTTSLHEVSFPIVQQLFMVTKGN